MAVEAGENGATGAGGGLLARAEAEANKEREMGGEAEHIAGRDGDGGSGRAGELPAANSDSFGCVDDARVEGNVDKSMMREGNGRDEVGEEERDRRDSFPVVNGCNDDEGAEKIRAEQGEGRVVAIEDSKSEGHEEEVVDVEVLKNGVKNQVEEGAVVVEYCKEDAVIKYFNNGEEASGAGVSKNADLVEEGVFIVEDSKDEMEAAVGDLNNEQDAVMDLDEGDSEGREAPNVQNEAVNVTEGQSFGAASGQTSSSDPTIDGKQKFKSLENEVLVSSVAQPENKDVKLVSEIQENKKGNDERSGVVKSSVNEKKEVDSASEIEEKRDFNDEVLEGVDSCKPVNEEITSIYDLEDRRDADNEGFEDVESSVNEPMKRGLVSDSEIERRTNNKGHKNVDSAVNGYAEEEVDSAFDFDDRKIANDDFSICSNRKNETKSAIQVDENLQNITTTTVSDSENGELNSSVEQAQQHHLSASLPKSDSVSSIKLIAESVEEKIASGFLVGLSIGAASGQAFSSDPTIDEKQNFESLLQENVVFVSSLAQPENKDVELISEIEEKNKGNDERSGVVESSGNEKKEVGSASEIEEIRGFNDEVLKGVDSSESAKEDITSIYELEDRTVADNEGCEDVESSANGPTKKGLVSDSWIEERTNDEVCKDVESAVNGHLDEEVDPVFKVGDWKIANHDLSKCCDRKNETKSAIQVGDNLQIIATSIVSDSKNGELNSSVEQVQQHHLSASLPDSEEKDFESSIKLTAEPVEENIGSESSSTGKSTELVEEFISATRGKDKYSEALSTGSKPEHAKEELGSALEIEEIGNVEVSFIASYPEPVKRHLASTSKVEEGQDADAFSIYSNPEPVKEDIYSASKPEQDAEAFVTEADSEKMELQLSTELADVATQPVKDLEGTENQHNDLKSEKDLIYQAINENRELKSAAKLTKHAETHLDKDLLEIEGQQKELKSEENQASVHSRTQQENAASSASAGDEEKSEKLVKKYYIVKMRRFNQRVIDDERQAKIHEAKMQIDEKTRSQDSIMSELRNMRTVLSGCCDRRDSAIKEEKRVKSLVNAKRQEMDSTQALISKGKNVASFLDINSQIHALEHKIQHETISLKDEKNCLHELKRLKHERENHPFNNYSESEFDEALKQKETAESSLRTLKKEFDILRREHSKADEYSKAASKSYFDQFNKIKEHEKKWKAANDQRQNAFKNLHGLTSDKHYKLYLYDRQTAMKYASSGDTEALERFCTEQIERVMQLWNEDEDFRRHYIESSAYSRIHGRNEKLVVPPSYIPPPSTTRSSVAPVTACEEQMLLVQEVTKPVLQTKQMVRSKPSSKSTSTEAAPIIGAMKEELVDVAVKEKLKKEEVEQARLADEQGREQEELRKEREAAELKEKLRMLQKAKAKDAEERKRRRTEKAQARAEYRAQKEAELREQKRAHKQKKKEATSETSGSVEGNPASVAETFSQETAEEPENNQRRSSRKSAAAALNKYSNDRIQPVPLPLRNKGKRKMSMWKCIVFAGAVVLLFIALLHFSDLAF